MNIINGIMGGIKGTIIALLGLFFLSVSGNGAETEASPEIMAKNLFENKCSLCHSINRPRSKRKSAEEWRKTVMRMKNVNGCPVSDEQAEIIIDYLTEKYPE